MISFSWEKKYKRTWEEGDEYTEQKEIREDIKHVDNYKKSLIRHFHILIDSTLPIEDNDYLPSIRFNLIKGLKIFVKKFKNENPLSYLTLSKIKDNKISKIISGSDEEIENLLSECGSGYFNINLFFSNIKILESEYKKEILIITSSVSTKDKINPKVFNNLIQNNVKIHFINIKGEVMLFKNITEITNGQYLVPLDYDHFLSHILEFTKPSTVNVKNMVELIKFGFPTILEEDSFCSCHLELTKKGYLCPICNTKVCYLPIRCGICNTQLVSTLNLAKSLFYYKPLKPFIKSTGICSICDKTGESMCNDCKNIFCYECDKFLHENINFCSFCSKIEEK